MARKSKNQKIGVVAFLEKSITQDKLREKLGYANCSTISRKFSGQLRWTPEDAKKLVKIFPGFLTLAMIRPDIWGNMNAE